MYRANRELKCPTNYNMSYTMLSNGNTCVYTIEELNFENYESGGNDYDKKLLIIYDSSSLLFLSLKIYRSIYEFVHISLS